MDRLFQYRLIKHSLFVPFDHCCPGDGEAKDFFRDWRQRGDCPWFVAEQYLNENGRRARGGAGPAGKSSKATIVPAEGGALEPQVYEARIAALLEARDFAGAAALQDQQALAKGDGALSDDVGEHGEGPDGSVTEHSSSSAEETGKYEAAADTRAQDVVQRQYGRDLATGGAMQEGSGTQQQAQLLSPHPVHQCGAGRTERTASRRDQRERRFR